ncbi:baseplate wedge subunit [Escherichia phage MIZ6]|uniref:Baseplate wedge subunit and tail pin n=3 Tax=Krischvirus RB49 TaxID=1985354 RepID=A0A6B9X4N6_9CAUD|nr:baseplate wedge subunit and tail pin [Shigella phage Sf20]QHR66068.1 baseplate wedge subunit and tail pin [Escherichia phage kaaroe]QHR71495.1 baseplate wedge subunit and tail pin [Escherichia phage kvi]QZI93993.1 baseplate wedge protein [Enterobacteria phage Whisky]USL84054.1 baseplate wedge subunit and tail pin [Escherichia phage W115]WMT11690.1 baseplate wedge subunit [Escherichia phage MIZ6]WNA14523.1 baseplate wedge subunit [Krischvirus RB49]CAH6634604.1 baseplate wedge subunit and t
MISKTRSKASVFSSDAAFISYDPGSKDPVIGGSRPIGGVNVDQSRKGSYVNNVQSAIDDLYSLSMIRIGDVLVTTNSTPPQAAGQIETLSFSGSVNNQHNPDANKVLIDVLGYPFIVDVGSSGVSLCEKVTEKFTELMNKNIMFKEVKRKGSSNDQLEIHYIDSLEHPPTDINKYGITITGNVDSPARVGYGSWSRMGTEEKFGTTLYYFKRIA